VEKNKKKVTTSLENFVVLEILSVLIMMNQSTRYIFRLQDGREELYKPFQKATKVFCERSFGNAFKFFFLAFSFDFI